MKHALPNSHRRLLLSGLLLSPLLGARAATNDHQHHHGHHVAATDAVRRSEAAVALPKLTLVRQDGLLVPFPQALDDGRPVLLNFIYTSCSAICPMSSQVFSKVQETLAAERESAYLVSISIDPEHDTPARLAEYARRFGAGNGWHFYTGTQQASVAFQKAFGAFRGDKMNHAPVTFLRAAPNKPWIRLDGFASPDDTLREFRAAKMG